MSHVGIGWAQNSEIRGMVADEKKAMIPGADVVVTHVATGTSRSTITNDVGFYSVPLSEGRRVPGEVRHARLCCSASPVSGSKWDRPRRSTSTSRWAK